MPWGRRQPEVADHTQGRLEVVSSWATAVGREKLYGSGEIRTSICGKPRETADQGLVRLAAPHKGLVLLVNGGRLSGVDGASGTVGVASGLKLMLVRR